MDNNFNKRYNSIMNYINSLIEVYSKINIIRIDLGYKKPLSEFITLDEANRDLNRLLNNTRSNKTVFGYLVGYVIKREYTVDRGIHFHVIFIFDGQKVKNDIFKADLIGNYWKNITNYSGSYYNCNRNTYENMGVGMINYFDSVKINLLKEYVLPYLCKIDQDIAPVKTNNRSRAFTRGVAPRKKTKVGRPRTKAMGMI